MTRELREVCGHPRDLVIDMEDEDGDSEVCAYCAQEARMEEMHEELNRAW